MPEIYWRFRLAARCGFPVVTAQDAARRGGDT